MPADLPAQSPPGWTRTQLGSLGTWSSGGTPSKARADYWLGTIPWVSPKDMKRFVLDDAEDHVSDSAATSGTRLVPSGSVFIVVRGMILAHTFPVCVAARPMAFNQDVKAIVPHGTTDGRFVAHWLNGSSDALLRLVTEATHGTKRLEQAELKAFGLDLPPLPEQRQIAAILDTIDDAIRKTEQIIAKLKQVKQGLLHDLFTRGIDDNGELRDPERHPEQFKDSPLGRIPRGWKVSGFGNIVVDQGGIKPGPFGSALTKASFVPAGYRVYGQEQVLAGDLRHGDYYIREAKYHSLLSFSVAEGDILMTMVGTIGKVLVVTRPFEPGVINPRLMRIRLRPDVAEARFVCELIRSSLVRRQFDRFHGGGTMPVLNQRILQGVILPIMAVEEQRKIIGVLGELQQRSACEELELSKLRELKRGLVEDLLTGRVRVTKFLEDAEP